MSLGSRSSNVSDLLSIEPLPFRLLAGHLNSAVCDMIIAERTGKVSKFVRTHDFTDAPLCAFAAWNRRWFQSIILPWARSESHKYDTLATVRRRWTSCARACAPAGVQQGERQECQRVRQKRRTLAEPARPESDLKNSRSFASGFRGNPPSLSAALFDYPESLISKLSFRISAVRLY